MSFLVLMLHNSEFSVKYSLLLKTNMVIVYMYCTVKDNILKILKNSLQEISAPGSHHNFLIIFPFQTAGNIMK